MTKDFMKMMFRTKKIIYLLFFLYCLHCTLNFNDIKVRKSLDFCLYLDNLFSCLQTSAVYKVNLLSEDKLSKKLRYEIIKP